MSRTYKIIAVILFISWLLVMWRLPALFSSRKAFSSTENASQAADSGTPNGPDYSETIKQLRAPFSTSRYNELVRRDIFAKPSKGPVIFSPDSLKLKEVGLAPLPFMYNGFIQLSSGDVIGQIAWSGKTHFVKKGGMLKDYKVTDITKMTMALEDKNGHPLILDFKKPGKSAEFIATLYSVIDGKTYEVLKEDQIDGYKILDIKPNSVILYGQNREWTINKEK